MRTARPILATAGICLALLGAIVSTGAAAASTAAPRPTSTPRAVDSTTAKPGATKHQTRRLRRTKAIMAIHRAAGPTHGTTTARMTYHGGYLMTAPAHVYFIWYGDWTGKAAVPVLGDLVDGLGGSAYAGTNATFTDSAGRHATTDIGLSGSTTVAAKHGARLSDAGVKLVVRRAVTSGRLPTDTDGIYVVLTSADVKETSGFGSRYCGWHTHATIAGADLKYAFVGDPTTQAPRGCGSPVNTTTSPNGDLAADAMASTLTHEIDETLTDPQLHGWYDQYVNENADKCAWTYGLTYPTAGGAAANVHLGSRDFLIQRNWIVAPTQGCALHA